MTVYVTAARAARARARPALAARRARPGRRPRPAGARGAAPRPRRPRAERRVERPGPPPHRGVTLTERRARARQVESAGFEVRLDNFEGPFDLLLSLISKHKLDITEVALSTVTDEFIAHVKAAGSPGTPSSGTSSRPRRSCWSRPPCSTSRRPGWCRRATSRTRRTSRCSRRATCCSRGCSSTARSRASPAVLAERLAGESKRHPRSVGLEERFANLLPEVLIGIGLDQFAALAAKALEPKPVARARPAAHPRGAGQRPRAGRDRGRAAAPPGRDDLPRAVRRLAGHADHGGAVPVAARAVPRGRGRLRPGDSARRADDPLDRRRRRGRRGPGDRRVRRRPARADPSRSRAPAQRPRRQNDHRDRDRRRDRSQDPGRRTPAPRCAPRSRRC